MFGADHIAQYYATLAPAYDQTAGYLDPVAERMRAPVKARLQKLLADRDVLEIACGSGYWTEAICKAAHSIMATDLQAEMIALARARLSGARNVRDAVADEHALRNRHMDDAGNTVEERVTPGARMFEVIKNVPSEQVIHRLRQGIASDIDFHELPKVRGWMLTYSVAEADNPHLV